MMQMIKKESYSVYIHTNILNDKKYIGITKQKPEKRWQKGFGYEGTYFGNAIKKYGWDGFLHEVVITGLNKEQACKIEIVLISIYRSNNRKFGYNISDGGQTTNGMQRFGEEHPNHQRVNMIDPKTKKVMRTFVSQTEAAKILGISRKCITKACIGIGMATYKGYIWEYADKEYKKPVNPGIGNYEHTKIQKRVQMVDTDGTIYEFESVKNAGEFLGVRPNTLSRYITGVRKDPKGRRWCYA